jgi:hypothetical protein
LPGSKYGEKIPCDLVARQGECDPDQILATCAHPGLHELNRLRLSRMHEIAWRTAQREGDRTATPGKKNLVATPANGGGSRCPLLAWRSRCCRGGHQTAQTRLHEQLLQRAMDARLTVFRGLLFVGTDEPGVHRRRNLNRVLTARAKEADHRDSASFFVVQLAPFSSALLA